MARMHSRAKGKAKSRKPIIKQKPSWIKYSTKEIEMIVVKLAKQNNTASQIGAILRDTYGIPDIKALTNKSITQILKEKEVAKKLPEDLTNLIKRLIKLQKHLEENKQDKTAKRGLLLTRSKINRLIKYYKKSNVLEETWKFDSSKANIYVE